MKILTALVLLISGQLFAQELDATTALLSTLNAGEYKGLSPRGEECSVRVSVLSGKVAVTVYSEGLSGRSEVQEGATYRWNPANRSFLSSVFTTTLTGSRENILRTIAVTQKTQYVVVADVVINDREVTETTAECIINL